MNITIRYYGQLAEIAGCTEETQQLEHPFSLSQLTEKIQAKNPAIRELALTTAVNNRVFPLEKNLNEGDCVDLFPPFSGG